MRKTKCSLYEAPAEVVHSPHTKLLSETPLFRLLLGCVIHSLHKLYATGRRRRKSSSLQGFATVFFLFPSPPQKGVKERVAAWARSRPSGNTLFIPLGWGACCQSERLLRSPGCHPERSAGSLRPASQTLRGVYPERSEWCMRYQHRQHNCFLTS